MATRSILQIEVNDGPFREFAKLHEKYMAALKKAPAAWAEVEKGIGASRESFEELVGKMAAARIETERREKAAEHLDNLTRSSAERWQAMARSTKDFARNIGDATTSLLRWASVTGVISGLIGAGGLFGIDRLALTAAGQRRGALGLGTRIGEQQAFNANFARLVDPDSFLGGVARAKLDINQRTGLIAAGLTPAQINGTTGETAVALLRNIAKLADKWDPRVFAQMIAAYRLEGVVSPEDLQRIRNTPEAEREGLFRGYGGDAKRFGLPDDVARRWQEFVTQLSKAGQGIEQTFIKGLVPLAGPLTTLSGAVEKVVQAFLKSGVLKQGIESVSSALEKFSGYVATEDFQHNVEDFVVGVGRLAKSVIGALRFFGVLPSGDRKPTAAEMAAAEQAATSGIVSGPNNNPGNLRVPGSTTLFQRFATPEAGLRAMADQLLRYERRDKLDTIEKILGKYAPPDENDTKGYIRDVAHRSGLAPDQRLDPNNTSELARLVAAMVAHEQHKGSYEQYKDAKVVVQVIQPAGSNVDVSVNGLKQ